MNTKLFGETSLPIKESGELKHRASEQPNLGLVLSWIFGGLLLVAVVVSTMLSV